MYVSKLITLALTEGKPFTQGNYAGIIRKSKDKDKRTAEIYYYGSKVFTATFKDNEPVNHKFDFCGYEGYSKTTRLINHCLRAINAKYLVSCAKQNGKYPEGTYHLVYV